MTTSLRSAPVRSTRVSTTAVLCSRFSASLPSSGGVCTRTASPTSWTSTSVKPSALTACSTSETLTPLAGTSHWLPPVKSMPRFSPPRPTSDDQAEEDDDAGDGEPELGPADEVVVGLAVVEAVPDAPLGGERTVAGSGGVLGHVVVGVAAQVVAHDGAPARVSGVWVPPPSLRPRPRATPKTRFSVKNRLRASRATMGRSKQ